MVMMKLSKVVFIVGAVASTTACTRWSTHNVYGQQRETARQMLGSPALAETKTSSLNAGFAGRANGGTAVAGLGANTSSLTLKHCVQQAELTFEQPYESRPVIRGRGWDIAGSVTLGLFGLGAFQAGASRGEYGDESSGTSNYIAGAVLVGSAIGLLAYSFGVVPNRPHPGVEQKTRSWQESRLVESTGCGLPGDLAGVQSPVPLVIQASPPSQQPDALSRLQQLDKLKAAGAISESDYQMKKKQIVDGI